MRRHRHDQWPAALRLAECREQIGKPRRNSRIGDHIGLADRGGRGQHEAQRGNEIIDAEKRAAVDEILERQRPGRARRPQQ